jgi:hypothetical protein
MKPKKKKSPKPREAQENCKCFYRPVEELQNKYANLRKRSKMHFDNFKATR